MNKYLIILIFISLSPTLVSAETSTPKDRMLIVGAPGESSRHVGAAQTLELEDIERHGYIDIHRMLRQVAGVNLHEEEGFGLFPHIGIRGTRLERNSRITLMEDGVLMSPAAYSASAAYYFPSSSRMSRIEVRKGSSAIKAGPYTTGGAVNLITTPIPDHFQAAARSQFGSYESSEHHLWLGDRNGAWSWLVEALQQSNKGYKQLDSSLYRGSLMPRPDTGFHRQSVLAKLAWESDFSSIYQRFDVKLSTDTLSANESYLGLTEKDYRQNPLRRYAGSQQDTMNTKHQLIQLKHLIQPSSQIDITTSIYRADFNRNWYKLASVQDESEGDFIGITSILADENEAALSWIKGYPQSFLLGNVRANNRKYISEGIQSTLGVSLVGEASSHELEFGLRFHRDSEDRLQWDDSYQMTNGFMSLVKNQENSKAALGIPGSQDNRLAEAEAISFYTQDEWSLGRWKLVPGVRLESIKQIRKDYTKGESPNRVSVMKEKEKKSEALLPGLGVSYELSENSILFSGIHRGFAPTGNDPDVEDEYSTNYEFGWRLTRPNLHIETTGFLTSYENLTGVCTASTGSNCVEGDLFDGGKVDVYGSEFMLSSTLAEIQASKLPVRLAYTWTKSRFATSFSSDFPEWQDVEVGDELAQIPAHQINLGLGLVASDWGIDLNTNFVSETRAVAGQGQISDEEKIDARTVLDLSGYYKLSAQAKGILSFENLTDERYIVARRPSGLRPGSPRMLRLGLEFRM